MCRCRSRALAGVVPSAHALPAARLPGHSGLVLVEYRGSRSGRLGRSLFSGVRYAYSPGRRFYADARDLGRVLAWQEDGERVFFMANGANHGAV